MAAKYLEDGPRDATPFPYDAVGDPARPESDKERVRETLHGVYIFIRDQVIARRNGKLPGVKTIAVRLIVLQALLDPEGQRSLRADARQLGCSPAWLSKVAIAFSDSIGMRAGWQRLHARKAYSERAKGVHAGTWQVSAERERALLSPKNKKSRHYQQKRPLQAKAPRGAGKGAP
jgi:hypothetical protein